MDTKWPLNTVESSTISKSQTIEANFFSLSIFLLSIILCSFSLSGVRANHRQAHALHPFSPSKDSPFFSASITNTASTHSLVFFTFFFFLQHVSLQFVANPFGFRCQRTKTSLKPEAPPLSLRVFSPFFRYVTGFHLIHCFWGFQWQILSLFNVFSSGVDRIDGLSFQVEFALSIIGTHIH